MAIIGCKRMKDVIVNMARKRVS